MIKLDGVNVTRELQRMLKNAEILPLRRFHDLRHTAATLLMAGNVHPRIVSELLGHSVSMRELWGRRRAAGRAQA